MADARKKNTKKPLDMSHRVLPTNVELEKYLLGSILYDGDISQELLTILKEEDFFSPINKNLFRKLKEKSANKGVIDLTLFLSDINEEDKLEIGGEEYVIDLVSNIVSTVNCEEKAKELQKLTQLRKLIALSDEVSDGAYRKEDARDLIDKVQSNILKIYDPSTASELVEVKDVMDDVVDEMIDLRLHPDKNQGIIVGFDNLDYDITNGGFKESQMIVLAARPGCGKTSFVMNMVANIARRNPEKVIAVFNLEMAKEELLNRLWSTYANVDSKKILRPVELSKEEYNRLLDERDRLANSNIFIDDTAGCTMEDIRFKVNRLKNKKKRVDLVVIDHMQLLDEKTGNGRYEKMTNISRSIKMMAKDLHVPVIALSQMSRSIDTREGEDRKPQMSDLKESGAIEQDADMIFFLSQGDFSLPGNEDEHDKNYVPIELTVAKNRSGETGEIHFGWHKDTMNFIVINKVYKKKKQKQEKEDDDEDVKENSSQEITVEASYEPTDEDAPEENISFAGVEDNEGDITSMIENDLL